MRRQFARFIATAFAVLLVVSLSFTEVSAQRKRTKRSRRVTNPVEIQKIPTIEPQIISTAADQQARDQQAAEENTASEVSGQVTTTPRRTNRKRSTAEPVETDEESVRRTVNDLSNQVTKLSEKLSQMEIQQRTLVDLERLSRAEQRAEALRAQLRDVEEKEGNLLARREQIDFDVKPENIERSVAAYGSTRPEDARDARRRALESEKIRVQAQLDSLTTSKQRLQSAIVSADLEVEKLRKRIDEATENPSKTDSTESTNETEETPTNTQTNPPPPPGTATTP